MVVYFVQSDLGGPIKIGKTEHIGRLKFRLMSLQAMAPFPLCVLRVIVDGLTESQVHGALRRYRLHGEWFLDTEEVRQLMSKYGESPPFVGVPCWDKWQKKHPKYDAVPFRNIP